MNAPMFAWLANPASVRSSCLWSGPSYCIPQPCLWMIGTMPSMFGYLSSRPRARTRSATYLLVPAEQLTVLMTAT